MMQRVHTGDAKTGGQVAVISLVSERLVAARLPHSPSLPPWVARYVIFVCITGSSEDYRQVYPELPAGTPLPIAFSFHHSLIFQHEPSLLTRFAWLVRVLQKRQHLCQVMPPSLFVSSLRSGVVVDFRVMSARKLESSSLRNSKGPATS